MGCLIGADRLAMQDSEGPGTMSGESKGKPRRFACPICGNTFTQATTTAMPFCSERCRAIDLARWLNEEYGLPCAAAPEEDDESDPSSAGGEYRG